MARRGSVCWLIATTSLAAIAPVALGATWSLVGTSGFSLTPIPGLDPSETLAEHSMTDANRIRMSGIVVDLEGNVFAIVNDWENSAEPTYTANGGVTIFKADGSIVNVNLRTAGLPGALTKLVLAGDGKVYGVQNWIELGYDQGRTHPHRIIRVNLDGTAEEIWNAFEAGTGDLQRDKIRSITVGQGGHVYWIMNEKDTYWREHFFWRYNIVTGVVEPSLHDGINDGWGQFSPAYGLEYVGDGWYVITSQGSNGVVRYVDAMRWDLPRTGALNNEGNDWGSQHDTGFVYDPVRKKLWMAPRGVSGGNYTAIMWRMNGDPEAASLFTGIDPETGKAMGIQDKHAWHANGNDPSVTGNPANGGKYWVQAIAINPADGSAWMSWSGDKYVSSGSTIQYRGNLGVPSNFWPGPYGPVGKVYTVGANDPGGPTGDEGAPRENAWVMSLGFGKRNGSCYVFALTLDKNDAQFRLYSAPTECPPTGSCCTRGDACYNVSLGECISLGGIYGGDGSTCEGVTCMSACCQKGNVCSMEMEFDCQELGGAFQPGKTCEQVDCRWKVCQDVIPDTDGDNDVDQVDFAIWQACLTTTGVISDDPVKCSCYDVAGGPDGGPDGKIDLADFGPFVRCGSGPSVPLDPTCND
ncbi:MAG TPA: hypothetical protein PK458_05660 [Phycisphaerae bacterium]|nr:hypothetical protein [Phycisphaerae bacterium]